MITAQLSDEELETEALAIGTRGRNAMDSSFDDDPISHFTKSHSKLSGSPHSQESMSALPV